MHSELSCDTGMGRQCVIPTIGSEKLRRCMPGDRQCKCKLGMYVENHQKINLAYTCKVQFYSC